MPKYRFICSECESFIDQSMKISKFMELRNAPDICSECKVGILEASLYPTKNDIERRKEDILEKIEEEVREIVQKVHDGDEATIADVYGNEENLKKG